MNGRRHWVTLLAAAVLLAAGSTAEAALIGYWTFDGNTLDSSGSGFNGTPVNSPGFVPGQVGQAIELNGSNQYVTTTSATNLGLNGSFTASAWVRPDATNGDRTVFGTDQTGTNVGLHLVIRNDRPHMGFYANDTGGNRIMNTGQWQLMTWRFDAGTGTQSIIVNGQLDASGGGHAAFAGTDVVNIGRWASGNYFDGLIDEATIYNEALAPNQIQHLALGGNPANLPAADPNSFFWGTPSGPVLLGPTLPNGKRNAYQLVTQPEGLTWDQARVDAMTHTYSGAQGHLVTLGSAVESAFASAFGSGDRWMGFTDSNATSAIDGATMPGLQGQQFRWVTGEPVTYTNWGGGEPNLDTTEDAANLPAGSTLGQADRLLNAYVIEYDVDAPGSATGPRLLTKLGPVLPDGTRNAYDVVLDGSTWVAAKVDAQGRQFQGQQGHLVTIGSAQENAFVQSQGGGWIGFTDDPAQAAGASEGNFVWVTGEPVVYTNWNAGEPNNSGGAENFGLMYTNGLWNDGTNTGPQNYVVEYNVARTATPAFQAHMMQLGAGAPDTQLNRAGEALSVLSGFGVGTQYNVTTNATDTPTEVNYASGGDFPNDQPYPNGQTDPGEDFAVRVTSRVHIPAGEWSIAFSGDDGGYLHLDGVQFVNQINTNGDTKSNDGTLVFDAANAHSVTIGHFTVPAGGMNTSLDAMFFERGGGQQFEVSIAPGYWPGFNAAAFGLLVDGQYGWSATPTPPHDGFGVRMIQLDPSNPSGFNTNIDNAQEAVGLALGVTGTGDFSIGGQAYRVTTFVETTSPYVDFGGGGGDFNEPTLNYPNGRSDTGGADGEDFLVGAQAFMRVPAGTYTIAFGSDDGGVLQLTDPLFGTTFSFDQEINTNGDPGLDDAIWFNDPRGHSQTMGIFTLDEESILELNALFFERGGGDSFEISIAKGAHTSFNTTDFFILRNNVFPGLLVAPTLLAVVPEPSTLALLGLGVLGMLGFVRRRRR
jgi:hypothetical protein